ncbi:MAG: response regulator [bacterium]|nr:response regulator [bacterium]
MNDAQKILLIDDDSDARETIAMMLERDSFTVSQANSAEEAMQFLATERPALVITDIVMPGIDGIELITTLREKYPLMKVIAISGGLRGFDNSANILLPLALKSGALKIVRKPFTRAELLEAVTAIINGQ